MASGHLGEEVVATERGGLRRLIQAFRRHARSAITGILACVLALVGMFSGVLRRLQSGYIYHYAFSMIIGVFVLLTVRNWLN